MTGKTIKVTLAKAHTHGGKEHTRGDVIEVTESQAARLEKVGSLAKTTVAKATEKKKEDK